MSTSERKCLFVILNQHASYLNLCTFYLVQFSYVCFFTFMDSMQPHLLDEKEGYIKYDKYTDEIAQQINTDLLFYDNLYLVRKYFFYYLTI